MNDEMPFCSFMQFIKSKDDTLTLRNAIQFTDEILDSLDDIIKERLKTTLSQTDSVILALEDKLKKFVSRKVYDTDIVLDSQKGCVNACVCKHLSGIEDTLRALSEKAETRPQESLVLFTEDNVKEDYFTVYIDDDNKTIWLMFNRTNAKGRWEKLTDWLPKAEALSVAKDFNFFDKYNKVYKQQKGNYDIKIEEEEAERHRQRVKQDEGERARRLLWNVYFDPKDGRIIATNGKVDDRWRKVDGPFDEKRDAIKAGLWQRIDKANALIEPFNQRDNTLYVKDRNDEKYVVPDELEKQLKQESEQALQRMLELEERKKEPLKWVNWSKTNVCSELGKLLDGKVSRAKYPIGYLLSVRSPKGEEYSNPAIEAFINAVPLIPQSAAKGLSNVVRLATDAIDSAIDTINNATGCDIGQVVTELGTSIVLSLANKWLGISIPKINTILERNINTQCPDNIPSEADADDMFLADVISKEEWQCWIRANNTIATHREKLIEARRQRQSANELLDLWKRNIINQNELDKRLRGLGWTSPKEIEELKKLSYSTPSPSDLIPWMLRDVFDPVVIKEFGLDDEFQAKYTARAKELFRAAGVNDEVAKYEWMAHWNLPSATQAFEMYHRLRGGKKDSGIKRYFDKDGNRLPEPKALTQDDIAVSEEQIARLLGVNDIAPFWRDKLLAISRPPLTRVDVRRAYEIDSITENEVYESYRDLGYDEDKARTLTNFAKQLKEKGDVRRKGRLLPTRIAALFKQSAITETEALDMLQGSGIKEIDAKETLRQAKAEIKAKTRLGCIKAIKKRFMIGDIDETQLRKMLDSAGLDLEQIVEMVKAWKCELSYKTKEVTATMLCDWYSSGLMDDETYKKRLVRIGYTEEDADRIIEACEFKATVPSKERAAVRNRVRHKKGIKTKPKSFESEVENGETESK